MAAEALPYIRLLTISLWSTDARPWVQGSCSFWLAISKANIIAISKECQFQPPHTFPHLQCQAYFLFSLFSCLLPNAWVILFIYYLPELKDFPLTVNQFTLGRLYMGQSPAFVLGVHSNHNDEIWSLFIKIISHFNKISLNPHSRYILYLLWTSHCNEYSWSLAFLHFHLDKRLSLSCGLFLFCPFLISAWLFGIYLSTKVGWTLISTCKFTGWSWVS